MSALKLVPAVRFGGFGTSWEQRKFGELYEKVSEKNDLTYGRSSIISVANMYYNPGIYVADDEYLKTYNVFKLGDIAFEGNRSKDFAFGRFVENTIGDGIISHVFDVFRPKEPYDLLFWKYAIHNESLMKRILARCTKSSTMMTNLVADDFLQQYFLVPSVAEQAKIGDFLESLDKLITLYHRKHEIFSNIKKSMLEKMFPKEGEKFPEIRFSGFTDAWEQRKLSELGKSYSGLSGKRKEDFGHGKARFVTYMNVFSNPIADSDMTEVVEVDPRQNEVEAGDVFFTVSSETPEEVGMSSVLIEKQGVTYLNSFCFGFRPTVKLGSYYLAYLLRSPSFREMIVPLAQGISRYNISKAKVLELPISIPNKEEQLKIGQFFKAIDGLVTLHQRKCEMLENIKKSCLERMLV